MRRFTTWLMVAAAVALSIAAGAHAQRQMENLGRGVVAINQGDGKVFVGWRLLGTDPHDIAFNVYRSTDEGEPARLNVQPLAGPTSLVDTGAKLDRRTRYFVRPVLNGREQAPSASFTLPANAPIRPYVSIQLKSPAPVKTAQGEAAYTANDISVGDLDGDGEYEIVVHQAGRGKDNSHNGETDPPILQAYKLDGTLLWTINLGRNIREGAHYTQFMVYDLDSDGRAETVCKTADGTTDSQGKIIGDPNANYVSESGRILTGPEYLTVFDSAGRAVATTKYLPGRHPDSDNPTPDQMKTIWGDGYGNRMDRFLACVAYLDGVNPSVVMCRGYYTRSVLAAWDWRGGKLTSRWVFDTASSQDLKSFAGQGNHNLSVADVDADGKDEIVYGGMTVDDNGKGLYTTDLGHGDAIHVSDLDPGRPGLEVFRIQEPFADAGAHLFDARTGAIIWKKASVAAGSDKEGPGRGLALDIDPRYPGFESWVAGAGLSRKLWDAKGNQIADATPSVNMAVYWDGDLLRETLDGTRIGKWDYVNSKTDILLDGATFGCVSNNGTKANPALSADILGDWREEVIWRSEDNTELRIFTTTSPTEHRLYTLMHDPQYRLSIAWQNVGYNQPPHPGFYIGPEMKPAPRPAIKLVVAAAAIDGSTGAAAIADPIMPATSPPAAVPASDGKPTLWLIGDSTVNNGTAGQKGWGSVIGAYFDTGRITVANRARGGRSSRTFLTEGLWDKVLADMKPGDFVMMQFGHNDGGRPEGVYPQGRASLKGSGDETREVETKPGQTEVVHTFGWYLRRYIADARAKGATPIVLSMVPRNDWKDGKVLRASGGYGGWAAEAAKAGDAIFIDLNEISAHRFEVLGQEAVKAFFPNEHTHTNTEGADVNARSVIAGIKALPDLSLNRYLSAGAAEIPAWKPAGGL